ncbi:MAG: choice-of-anchor B family protein [Flavobacteriales bacterium]
MRFLAASLVSLCLASATAQNYNLDLLGHVDYQALHSSNLSNLWGYADEVGNEYAIVGVNGDGSPLSGGVSIVDVTDPANPVEVFFMPGPPSIWREIKTYGDYAYITTEAAWGLSIIDLSPLPASTNLPNIVIDTFNWQTMHSLFIDESNGRLFLNGSDVGNGGVIIYDLTQDPMDPVQIGTFDDWYVHDCYAHGDTFYGAHVYDGFMSIVDISDLQNPDVIATQITPSAFTHNVWTDDTRDFIFTTDERDDAFIGSYDISDPLNIEEADRTQSNPGSDAIPHNTYWLHDNLATSYYTYGVVIHDVSDPHNMVEVGHYDTSPNFGGGGFNGCWGVFPFLPSGNILASDIEEGLFILGPTFVQPCWLEGVVTDQLTTAPVNNALLTIDLTTISENTIIDGTYATGYHQAGTYSVTVTALGYLDQTVTGVQLVNGQVTTLDVQLVPLTPFALQGQVLEQTTNTPIEGADVLLQSTDYTFNATTDVNGNFTVPAMFAADYTITAGHWGHITACLPAQQLDQNSGLITIHLPVGWYDDFSFDFGWNETGNASTGAWERGEPVGTVYQNSASNPDVDVNNDCSDRAYVTGNGGGGAGDDDVDDGTTTLTSPVFDLSSYFIPEVGYARWFFNDGGTGAVNDEMMIYLTNGIDTIQIELVDDSDAGMGTWVSKTWSNWTTLPLTANMRFIASIRDETPGHIVEGGLDKFEVAETSSAGIHEEETFGVSLWPNPNDGSFTIAAPAAIGGTLQLFDAQGRAVGKQGVITSAEVRFAEQPASGVYSLRVASPDGTTTAVRVVVK